MSGKYEMTPLALAARQGDLGAVTQLVREDAEALAGRDVEGRTVLHEAVAAGHSDIVAMLIRAGADVAASDRRQMTPLHLAICNGHVDIARSLALAGAPVDEPDADGNTPLSNAVYFSGHDPSLVHFLVARGADPDRHNLHGVSPRGLAEMADGINASEWFPQA